MSKTEILFRIGLALKGFDSLLEAVGGVLLFTPVLLNRAFRYVVWHEIYFIGRHPLAARLANSASKAAAEPHYLMGVYLVLHGLLKLVFIIAVFRQRRWGYFGILAILLAFCGLEFYDAATRPSWAAAVFGLFDLILAGIIANEYRIRKADVR